MDNLQVTYIMACYNQAPYISEAIYSVLNQTYQNIQLIVFDDCSTDGSIEVLKELNGKEKFTLIQNEINRGVNFNVLNAMKLATGNFIALLASDDYVTVEKIEKQVAFLLQTGNDAVFANGYSFNHEAKHLITVDAVFKGNNKLKIQEYICTCDWEAPLTQSALFKRHLFDDLLSFRQEYKSDDWAFTIKAYEKYNVGFMDEPFFYYRLHDNNTHKKYWFTFPMRLEVVSKLIPEKFKIKGLSNIMFSQGNYLLADGKFFAGIKFYLSSVIFHISFKKIIIMAKQILIYFKNLLKKGKV